VRASGRLRRDNSTRRDKSHWEIDNPLRDKTIQNDPDLVESSDSEDFDEESDILLQGDKNNPDLDDLDLDSDDLSLLSIEHRGDKSSNSIVPETEEKITVLYRRRRMKMSIC
jgi:hypothetical protein